MPFAAAAERVVLAQWKAGEFLGHENAPQVGMPGKANAIHIEDLALHPVGAFPEREDRGDGWIGVVDVGLDDEALAGSRVHQDVPNAKAIARAGVAEVVGCAELGELIEACFVPEKAQYIEDLFGGSM